MKNNYILKLNFYIILESHWFFPLMMTLVVWYMVTWLVRPKNVLKILRFDFFWTQNYNYVESFSFDPNHFYQLV